MDLQAGSNVLAVFVITIINFILRGIGSIPFLGFLNPLADFLESEPIIVLLTWIVAITIMITWAAALHVLTFSWLERKIVARLQDRRGPMITLKRDRYIGGTGYPQQIADAVKLLQKENITPAAADRWMFHLAPVFLISSLLLILAAFSLTPVAVLLAGWAQNSEWAGGERRRASPEESRSR